MQKIILFIISAFFLSACSRDTSEKVKVAIQVPASLAGNGTLSSEELKHIVINVSGSGMSQFVYAWDSEQSDTPPEVFTFEFEQGTSRLIQALTVYEDSDTGMMNFYYGDAGADFNSSSVNIQVPISKLTSGYNASGNFSGRYLTTDTSGPSGPVSITYKPTGKPAMLIEKSYIYNGWFNFFSLSEIEFTYSMDDGTVLFGGPMKFANTTMLPNSSAQVFKMQVPNYKKTYDGSTYDTREPRTMAVGWFFGSGVSASVRAAKAVCLDSISSTISGAHKYNDTSSAISLQSQTHMNSVEDLFDFQSSTSLASLGKAVYTGGTSTGACANGISATAEYQSLLTLNSDLISKFDDGGDLILGPLLLYDRLLNEAVPVSGSLLKFQLLPGVELAVDQVRVYPVSSALMSEFSNKDSKQFPCDRVVGSASYVSTATSASGTAMDLTPLQSIFTADPTAGRALCFFKDAKLIPSGFLIRSQRGSGGGLSVGSSAPYLRIELSATWNSTSKKYELGQNTCTAVQFKSFIGQGTANSVSQAATVSGLSAAGGNYSFYSDSTCTTNAPSSVTFSIGDTIVGTPIYLKTNSGISTDIQFSTVSVSGGGGMTFDPTDNMFDISF